MKIAIYKGKNSPTCSLSIMADDYARRLPNAYVTAKIPELKGADVVLNLVIEDIPKIEEGRRYVGYGKQTCFFAGNSTDYAKEHFIGLLAYISKINLIVHSQWHMEEVMRKLDVFSAGFRRKIAENTHLCYGGIEEAFVSRGTNDRNLWMVPYNHANEIHKGMKNHTKVMNEIVVYMNKKKLEIPRNMFYVRDIVDPDDYRNRWDLSNYEVENCPEDRADYIANCQKTGIFVSTSVSESFGLMYLELLASGAVGIFLDKPWIRRLLPDYKLVTDMKNLSMMAVATYNDFEKAQQYVQSEVVPEIRKWYDAQNSANAILKVLEATA